jgi:hypothetical protein
LLLKMDVALYSNLGLQIRLQEKKKVFVYVLNSCHFVLRLTILFVYPKAKSRPK